MTRFAYWPKKDRWFIVAALASIPVGAVVAAALTTYFSTLGAVLGWGIFAIAMIGVAAGIHRYVSYSGQISLGLDRILHRRPLGTYELPTNQLDRVFTAMDAVTPIHMFVTRGGLSLIFGYGLSEADHDKVRVWIEKFSTGTGIKHRRLMTITQILLVQTREAGTYQIEPGEEPPVEYHGRPRERLLALAGGRGEAWGQSTVTQPFGRYVASRVAPIVVVLLAIGGLPAVAWASAWSEQTVGPWNDWYSVSCVMGISSALLIAIVPTALISSRRRARVSGEEIVLPSGGLHSGLSLREVDTVVVFRKDLRQTVSTLQNTSRTPDPRAPTDAICLVTRTGTGHLIPLRLVGSGFMAALVSRLLKSSPGVKVFVSNASVQEFIIPEVLRTKAEKIAKVERERQTESTHSAEAARSQTT